MKKKVSLWANFTISGLIQGVRNMEQIWSKFGANRLIWREYAMDQQTDGRTRILESRYPHDLALQRDCVLVTQYRHLQLTRSDTRPPVADGWAGAEMCVFPLFNSSVTDRPTNGRTKPLIDLRVCN